MNFNDRLMTLVNQVNCSLLTVVESYLHVAEEDMHEELIINLSIFFKYISAYTYIFV